jgi:hypothetical protein
LFHHQTVEWHGLWIDLIGVDHEVLGLIARQARLAIAHQIDPVVAHQPKAGFVRLGASYTGLCFGAARVCSSSLLTAARSK